MRTSVDYLGRILGLVLESESLSNAVAIQEFSDRSSERWLTLPCDSARNPGPVCMPSDLAKQRKSDKRKASNDPVDLRKELVAYDTYKPGQVSYQGGCYNRRDILLLHHKLIEKARKAFNMHV